MSVIATPTQRGRPGLHEGDQRHRHDAAPRRLPEGPERAPARGEVVADGLRRLARATRRCSPRRSGPRSLPRAGCAKDSVEVEGYVRGFSRRRPDVDVTMLRFANIIGPEMPHPAHRPTSTLPVVPTVLGLRRAAAVRARGRRRRGDAPRHRRGRRRGRTTSPATASCSSPRRAPAGRPAGRCPCRARGSSVGRAGPARRGLADFSPEQMRFLAYGRGVDTTRMREVLGLRARVHDARGLRRLRPRHGCDRAAPPTASGPPSTRRSRRSAARPSARRRRVTAPRARQVGPIGSPASRWRNARRRRTPHRASAPRGRADRPDAGRGHRRAPPGDADPAGGDRSRRPATSRRAVADALAFLAAPADRRLRGRRVRLRPRADRHRAAGRCCARSTGGGSGSRCAGIENIPTDGGALVVANHSGTIAARRAHDPARRARRAPRHAAPADARRRPGVPDAVRRRARPQGRCHPRVQRRRRAAAARAASSSASGRRASRASASRSASGTSCSGSAAAASCRRRCGRGMPIVPCSIVGAEEIYPMIGNIRAAGPAARACPTSRSRRPSRWLGPLGLVPLPSKWIIEFGEPIAHRRATPAAPPTTRCWSSTSPTRCARPSSRPSTRCSMQRRSVFF